MRIHLILTGGTIDKLYNPLQGQLGFSQTHIPAALEQGRCGVDVEIQQLCLKDSLEMTDQDRAQILEACRSSAHQQIIITHGTDTMAETARYLIAANPNKTIVLTGAMIPLSVNGSDGLFNLGSALVAVQVMPTGVYIAMNGRVFNGAQVTKNRGLGVFEALH
ncbi:MAG: asparaginase [Thiothrix sp.]|nr:MAG: asparaginase [Thiothrix sp.]